MGRVFEANFDGLVGPTYNNAGSAVGNKAAAANRGKPSNPRAAALQGLAKMKFLFDLGLVQGVLPPHERPYIPFLRRLGFEGTDAEVLERAGRTDLPTVEKACSSAAMWAANAATVTPSSDSADGKVHFTPANLVANLHRSLEAGMTHRVLQRIFPEGASFAHHPPLPAHVAFGDEGAANHMRLCRSHADPGLHLFAYGQWAFDESRPRPAKYPARQTWEASSALARLHRLHAQQAVFVQQSPEAIDGGAFHNDVIAFSNESLLVVHEQAFVDTRTVLEDLRQRMNGELDPVMVKTSEMSLQDVISSYLFNSQLVTVPGKGRVLLVQAECDEVPSARRVLDRLLEEGKIHSSSRFNLRESMSKGGGPACLRLRVVLTGDELAQTHPGCLLSEELYQKLVAWVTKNYRDKLLPEDLADPGLLGESRAALDELSGILNLGAIYSFQGGEE